MRPLWFSAEIPDLPLSELQAYELEAGQQACGPEAGIVH
jgi:hypothetical protein